MPVQSPIAAAAERSKTERLTNQEFYDTIKYFATSVVSLVKLAQKVEAAGPTGLEIKGKVFKRSTINSYLNAYVSQLNHLKPIYRNRGKKRTGNSNQLKRPFFVSDQLVNFFKGANLGPASANGKGKLAKELSLITDHNIATAGILTSLFSRYNKVNNLRPEGSKRFQPDKHMLNSFSDTAYMLRGEDISERFDDLASDVKADKREAIRENIAHSSKSAFARLEGRRTNRKDGKQGELFHDSEGYIHSTIMSISGFCRIPNELLSDEEREELNDPKVLRLAEGLQDTLTGLTDAAKSDKKTAAKKGHK